MASCKYSLNALVSCLNKSFEEKDCVVFFIYLQRRASSSAAVASTANQRSVPQTKSGQFGIPQRIKLPQESINVSTEQKRFI
jgi:hypothetical protein